MDEVDNILLSQLREFGIRVPDKVTAISGITSEILYSALVKCMKPDLPSTFPSATSQRCRVCTTLASLMAAAGYPEEIAYNNILYPTVEETRSIVSWLLSRSVASGGQDDEHSAIGESARKNPLLLKGLTRLAQQRQEGGLSSKTGTPLRGFSTQRIIPTLPELSSEETTYVKANLKWVTKQHPSRHTTQCSLLEYVSSLRADAAAKLVRSMKTAHSTDSFLNADPTLAASQDAAEILIDATPVVSFAPARALYQAAAERRDLDAEAVLKRAQIQELMAGEADFGSATADVEGEERNVLDYLEHLNARVDAQREERAQLEAQKVKQVEDLHAIEALLETLEGELEEALQRQAQHQELLGYLADPDGSKRQLQEDITAVESVLTEQQNTFETKRSKWTLKAESLRMQLEEASQKCTGEMEDLHAQITAINAVLAEKEKECADLRGALATRQEKDNPEAQSERSSFIRKLMDMMRHVRKQQIEIDKHSANIRAALTEIENVVDDRERTFREVEAVVYKEAARAEFPRNVYKRLVSLREAFEGLVQCVEARGGIRQQQHAVEERKAKLEVRVNGLDVTSVERDLQAVLAENESLLSGTLL